MKKFLLAAFVCLLSLNLSIGDAEAARLGGGRSIGMQRQAVTPRPAAPAQQAAPAPARPAPAGAPAPAAPLGRSRPQELRRRPRRPAGSPKRRTPAPR